jgi:hypothetical protein
LREALEEAEKLQETHFTKELKSIKLEASLKVHKNVVNIVDDSDLKNGCYD